MKKRFLLLIAATVLIGSLIGGTTFAFFTATASGTNSSFTAGTLKVALTDGDGQPLSGPFMSYDEMAPGDTASYEASVQNTGSLPLVYNFSLIRIGGPDAKDDALAAALLLKVERENGDGGWTSLGEQSVADWNGDISGWQPTLNAEQRANFRFTATLPLGTQNPAQGGTVVLTLLVSATQPSVTGAPAPGVLTGNWSGTYITATSNPAQPDGAGIWPFVATVTQTGNSFSGTMTDLQGAVLGPTAISGTIDGTTITGTRIYPITPTWTWPVNFTGTLQPGGLVVIGTSDNGPFAANKQP